MFRNGRKGSGIEAGLGTGSKQRVYVHCSVTADTGGLVVVVLSCAAWFSEAVGLGNSKLDRGDGR